MIKSQDDFLNKLNDDEKKFLETIQHYANLKQKIPYHKESEIRKKIIKCPNLFKLLLEQYVLNEDYDYLESILKNSIKYTDLNETTQNNWNYLYLMLMKGLFDTNKLKTKQMCSIADKTIQSLASKITTDVIKNKHINPQDKFPFILKNRIDNGVINFISVDMLNSYFEQITKYQDNGYSSLVFFNMTRLLPIAIGKTDFKSYQGINHCLYLLLIYLRKPEYRYALEILIKKVVSSDCLDRLENDVLELILEAWKVLEEESVLKLRLKPHPQTAKRLARLQQSYQLMKYLFRDKLANRDDVKSQLDSLFMG